MTIVHISLATPMPDGSESPAKGIVRFTPTARRTIIGTPDKIVLPSPFQVSLSAGLADVTLDPTAAGWAWRIDEHVPHLPARTIYVTVPNVVELDYTDLVTVDPDTLAPAPAPQAAWVQSQNLALARTPEALMVGAITRDAYGAPTAAGVVWPDGVTGTFTGTPSSTFPGSLDSYTVTHGTTTYTQPLVTRDVTGDITNQPAITTS